MAEAERKQAVRDSIDWCREQREHALARIKDFERGEKNFRAVGNGPLEDVTDKHRSQYIDIAKKMERLITAYEKLNV